MGTPAGKFFESPGNSGEVNHFLGACLMSSPKNLQAITPKSMLFKITSDNKDEKMYPGMIISYKVAPVLNIPMTWVTEITQVKKHAFFETKVHACMVDRI